MGIGHKEGSMACVQMDRTADSLLQLMNFLLGACHESS